MAIPPLTDRQLMVLRFVGDSIRTRGFPPTMREIGTHMSIASTNGVNDHLRALERKGYIELRDQMTARAIVLSDKGRRVIGAERYVPLQVTSAQCEQPVAIRCIASPRCERAERLRLPVCA